MTNTIDAETVTEFCLAPNWLGDGFCDDENNNAECFYDKLDCCKNRMHGNEFWDAFCTVCIPRQC